MSEFLKQFPRPLHLDDGGMSWFVWHNQKKVWLATLNWVIRKDHIAKWDDGNKFVFTDFIEQEIAMEIK